MQVNLLSVTLSFLNQDILFSFMGIRDSSYQIPKCSYKNCTVYKCIVCTSSFHVHDSSILQHYCVALGTNMMTNVILQFQTAVFDRLQAYLFFSILKQYLKCQYHIHNLLFLMPVYVISSKTAVLCTNRVFKISCVFYFLNLNMTSFLLE